MNHTRRYLMCPPEHFQVVYRINPWMDPTGSVDTALAGKQWTQLRDTLTELGHTVYELPPVPELPDMVYAANGGFVLDGLAYGARFRHPQRAGESAHHERWYRQHGVRYVAAEHINEGEGDLAWTGGLILAGHGLRTDPAAHLEVQEVFGRPVISLRLVDPRFYHLDTALAVLPRGVRPRLPASVGAAVPGRAAGRRGGRDRVRAQRRERRPARGRQLRGDRDDREARRRRLRAGPGGPVRAEEGRRQRQVLRTGAALSVPEPR
jgi:hypothetical protein